MFQLLKNYFFVFTFCLLASIYLNGQVTYVFSDNNVNYSGSWSSNNTLVTTTSNAPCIGSNHLSFPYSATNYWAGFGFNFNGWSTDPSTTTDYRGYSDIKLTYRGLENGHSFRIKFQNRTSSPITESNEVTIGTSSTSCNTVTLPMSLFANGSFDLSKVTDYVFSVTTNQQSFSGNVYVDEVLLVGQNSNTNCTINTDWKPANNLAWNRHSKISKGVNFSNWLEAYWLLPSNSFPQVNRYNRALVKNLKDLGFNSIRLPVTFERLASTTSPFIIPPTLKIWELIDSTLVWANDFDMNVTLCNHHGLPLTNTNYCNEVPRLKSIWGQVMARYKNTNPEKVFFELYNEPFELNNDNFRIPAQAMLDTVRSQAPNHTLILGATSYNSAVALNTSLPYPDSNVIYTFHTYDPFYFTHQGLSFTSPPNFASRTFPQPGNPDSNTVKINIDLAASWSRNFNVPVMLGEFGVSSNADAVSRCRYVDSVAINTAKHSMPWYYWDAISQTDAFGFMSTTGTGSVVCFDNALKLDLANGCSKMVSNNQDAGISSLREQLVCAKDGDTIYFHSTLSGQTIQLKDKPIYINKNIFLKNNGAQRISILSLNLNGLIYIQNGKVLTTENINLFNAIETSIENNGKMILKDCDIKTNNSEFKITKGLIEIIGNVRILKN
jgi:endoglucanase